MALLQLLAAGVLIVSDSENIGNMDKIAPQTQFFWDPAFSHKSLTEKEITNKKVLLVIHGYNNSFDYAIKSINEVNKTLNKLENKNKTCLYDLVIGYVWPGFDNFIDYGLAVENADSLKNRVRSHLLDLHQMTPYVDVLAHSLGNRVLLEALNFEIDNKPLVQNFYAMAPAVNAEAIELNHDLFQSTLNIKNLFVLHSSRDDVLKLAYPLTSGQEALGACSKPKLKKLPENVQFVDASDLVAGHGYYFDTKSIYKFLEKVSQGINPLPEKARVVKLKKNGDVKIIKD